jgi:hypothetical protein
MKKTKAFIIDSLEQHLPVECYYAFYKNEIFSKIEINGEILDLGGNSKSQYYKHIMVSVG